MKKINVVLFSFLVLVLALLTGAAITKANENNEGQSQSSISNVVEKFLKKVERLDIDEDEFKRGVVPMSLVINPQGEARITRGVVKAVSGDIVTVEVWKLNFSLHKMPDTKIFGFGLEKKGSEMKWEDIKINDVVDVRGQMDNEKPAFLHAGVVHERVAIEAQLRDRVQQLRDKINELIKKLNEILGRIGQPAT